MDFSTKLSFMNLVYLGILIFLFILASFDLTVGVSNDAVNFMSPAVGSKAAKFRTILIVAAIGILVGASTSSGMMDIARHGIMQPQWYTFEEVICIFLAVSTTDIILMDIFNTLGMPTSTTVSMVFGLLGGSTALALTKIVGQGHTYAELINTDKALSVILGIFLSVAIAFVFGLVVMWIARVVFTFNYKKHLRYTIAIFGGISITVICFFLIVSGLGQATFMTPEIKTWIGGHKLLILGVSFGASTVLMEILHLLKINVFKIVVLFGTFSLAMAFAGNDLVNFIGVPLSGLESFIDYTVNGHGVAPSDYTMNVLSHSNPEFNKIVPYFLIGASFIMITAIFRSKKARKVIETSNNLARQDEGEEVFSSSRIARHTVRGVLNTTSATMKYVPQSVKSWVNTRFNTEESIMDDEMSFDLVRASVNLVLAGLLIVIGTSLQLPLSTTYVAFMVAMGSSLADRAWGRESAVYRITGVITVIGGWFLTAGAAFIVSFTIATLNHLGGVIAMGLVMCVLAFILINNNKRFKKKQEVDQVDMIFRRLVRSHDKQESWQLLLEHVRQTQSEMVGAARDEFNKIIEGLFTENIRALRHSSSQLNDEKDKWKRYRRKEIIGMRKIDYLQAVEKNTWFHLGCNSCSQIIYCLKRMLEPCIEHVDNNFSPVPKELIEQFKPVCEEINTLLSKSYDMISTGVFTGVDEVLVDGNALKSKLSQMRHEIQDRLQTEGSNIKVILLYLNTLQESQELISTTRHLLRASRRFQE